MFRQVLMINNPTFSIIIPAYNAERTLADAIQSVFDQTMGDFKIIIVDDGSSDDTLKIATAIAENDERVHVITGENGGASFARNKGIHAATGKYVAFLDADDIWLPNKLEEQLKVFNSEPGVWAVRCGAYLVDDDLAIISRRPCYGSDDVLLEILLFQNPSPWMSTLAVERNVFSEIGLFDTDLDMIEDWDFAIRLARNGLMKSVEAPLAMYRQHAGNRSKDWRRHLQPGFYILKKVFSDESLPTRITRKRARIYSTFYLMICGAAFAASSHFNAVKWGLKAILTHPSAILYILFLPLRRRRVKMDR